MNQFNRLKSINKKWNQLNWLNQIDYFISGFSNRQSGAGILRSIAVAYRFGPRWISQWIFLLTKNKKNHKNKKILRISKTFFVFFFCVFFFVFVSKDPLSSLPCFFFLDNNLNKWHRHRHYLRCPVRTSLHDCST